MKTVIASLVTICLLLSMFLAASILNIQPVRAEGTIYIRADGSVDPSTAPISTVNNITYTLNDQIFESIVVERNNIVVDGAGYVIHGGGNGTGIDLSNMNNITIRRNNIENFEFGIFAAISSGNLIVENTLRNNGEGIGLSYSSGDSIIGNIATNNTEGIWIDTSSNSTILGNIATNNDYGILIYHCVNSTVYGNNITNNDEGLTIFSSSSNAFSQNNVTNNHLGIRVYEFSSNNTVSNNIVMDNTDGIKVLSSSGNNVSGNTVTFNSKGILLDHSSNNLVAENTVTNFYLNNGFGIKLDSSSTNNVSGNVFVSAGFSVTNSYENLVENNLVNNKPLVYLENASNVEVGPAIGAGQVILVDCDNIQVHDLDLSHTDVGVELWRTNNTWIGGNSISANSLFGVWLSSSYDNTISGNDIAYNAGAQSGVWLQYSSYNYVSENNITNNFNGIWLSPSSSFNALYKNRIAANDWWGVWLISSSYNSFGENEIGSQRYGVEVRNSSGNWFYHNNFDFNTQQVVSSNSTSSWDDGYPSGGNYWSDHSGIFDIKHGPFQNETGSDWIWDSPYVSDQNNTDRYPLTQPFEADKEDLRLVYRSLLVKFNEVNSDLESLSYRINDLEKNMTDLQGKCDSLETSVGNLQDEVISLNSTVQSLKGSLDSTTLVLNDTINNLQLQLSATNSTLQASIDSLRLQNNAMNSQLSNILNVLYIVTAIAAISAAFTIYLAVKRQKPKE